MDRIYPTELQLNKAHFSEPMQLFGSESMYIEWYSFHKMYNKRDVFDFYIVNFPFLNGDVPRRTYYGVYISQLIRFARASSNLIDFNCRNKALTAELLCQGFRYFKLHKAFSKFYRRQSALVAKCNISLKTLLQQGISEPEFCGDLVYRLRKIVGKYSFSEQFRKLIDRYKRIGYSLDIMRQTACQVIYPIIFMAMLHSLVSWRRLGHQTQWLPLRKTWTSGLGLDDGYASLFNCTTTVWVSGSVTASS